MDNLHPQYIVNHLLHYLTMSQRRFPGGKLPKRFISQLKVVPNVISHGCSSCGENTITLFSTMNHWILTEHFSGRWQKTLAASPQTRSSLLTVSMILTSYYCSDSPQLILNSNVSSSSFLLGTLLPSSSDFLDANFSMSISYPNMVLDFICTPSVESGPHCGYLAKLFFDLKFNTPPSRFKLEYNMTTSKWTFFNTTKPTTASGIFNRTETFYSS